MLLLNSTKLSILSLHFYRDEQRLVNIAILSERQLYGMVPKALPYIIYLIALWDNYHITLNPYMVMISSTPLVLQLKINLTLTIAIALDRTIALYFTVIYRRMPSALYADTSLLIGLFLACCDLTAEFILSPILPRPNCAAIGCFVSDRFRYYWGTCNMANRSAVGILMASLLFATLPSVGVGFVEMIGFSIFKAVGPFYILGLLSAGICNSIVYVTLNRDMRVLTKNCILGRPYSTTTPAASRLPSTAIPF